MLSVSRRVRQKVIAAAAVAVLLAGGALAAVSATGQSNKRATTAARRSAHSRELASAAAYLGVSRAQLSGQLSSGKTLAQVAEASAGKSKQGLIEALEASRRTKLSTATAKLQKRVERAVDRPGGPGSAQTRLRALFANSHGVGSLAAAYLGVSSQQLQSELRSGKTLAQLADASAGKSEAGLIAALLAAKRSRLDSAVAAGRLTQARSAMRQAHLQRRITRLVQRSFVGAGSRG
jgi:hypothetical protein